MLGQNVDCNYLDYQYLKVWEYLWRSIWKCEKIYCWTLRCLPKKDNLDLFKLEFKYHWILLKVSFHLAIFQKKKNHIMVIGMTMEKESWECAQWSGEDCTWQAVHLASFCSWLNHGNWCKCVCQNGYPRKTVKVIVLNSTLSISMAPLSRSNELWWEEPNDQVRRGWSSLASGSSKNSGSPEQL